MENEEFVKFPLSYGRTGETDIPFIPGHISANKFFCVGYNSRYGLVNLHEDDGTPYFEGRINIESLLSEIQLEDRNEVNLQVESHIMDAYHNLFDYQNNPRKYEGVPPEPILEVLTCED